MVGGVSAAGVLDAAGRQALVLWQESAVLCVVAIAWGSAILTSLLNAGPTTALLLHVLMAGMGKDAPPVIWCALSLGVCAGSSATLTGATAGPIAARLLEARGKGLSFSRFAQTGVPLGVLYLSVSSIYLVFLVW
jgi:Na+/H+ antiporter NhaD/arsenite permease-like protein